MTKTIQPLALLALTSAILAGCAGSGDRYPSLATRDAERDVGQLAAPPLPGPAPTASARTITQLREIAGRARASHQEFLAAQSAAETLTQAARGTGEDNDTRAQAMLAFARLSILHSKTNLALSDLDQLEFSAASTFSPSDEILAAQILVGEMVADQNAVLDSLESASSQ